MPPDQIFCIISNVTPSGFALGYYTQGDDDHTYKPAILQLLHVDTCIQMYMYWFLRPAYTAKVSGTCFWNSNTKQLGDLFQKQKIKGSLWNLCAVYAGLYTTVLPPIAIGYLISHQATQSSDMGYGIASNCIHAHCKSPLW